MSIRIVNVAMVMSNVMASTKTLQSPASSTTSLRNVPTPSMLISIVSPGAISTVPSEPSQITSPG